MAGAVGALRIIPLTRGSGVQVTGGTTSIGGEEGRCGEAPQTAAHRTW